MEIGRIVPVTVLLTVMSSQEHKIYLSRFIPVLSQYKRFNLQDVYILSEHALTYIQRNQESHCSINSLLPEHWFICFVLTSSPLFQNTSNRIARATQPSSHFKTGP